MTLLDANDAAKYIYDVADPDAQIIFGAGIDEEMEDAIKVTVIATGFDGRSPVSVNTVKTQSSAGTTGGTSGSIIKPTIFDDDLVLPDFLKRDKE